MNEMKAKRVKVHSWELLAGFSDRAVENLIAHRISSILSHSYEHNTVVDAVFMLSDPKSNYPIDEALDFIVDLFSLWHLRRIEIWKSTGTNFEPFKLVWVNDGIDISKVEYYSWDTVVQERKVDWKKIGDKTRKIGDKK